MEGAHPMSGAAVALRAVVLHRGARQILNGVTFDVPPGTVVALMGPSGSGKTTILRTIAGLEPFDGGTIAVDGVTLTGGHPFPRHTLNRLRRRVGVVFQFHHLFEHLTAIKNVWLAPVHAHGVAPAEAQRRARELLHELGVEERAHALPRELSGGEAQRVAIARALAIDPPLLMMDEPTASLDPARRHEVGRLLQRLAGENRTILISTHDEEFARAWASDRFRVSNGLVSRD
jgi:polar amino acid transport system ATP-binding protein